eukprot:m.448382 g.448382  ORF g.448382 m.448382 type:complete len:831 (+) comp19653_c0_seq1:264-2756(+)
MATTSQSVPERPANTLETQSDSTVMDPLAEVITKLKADPVLTVLASKTTELGSAPTNQARVQRVKEIVTQMDAKCTLFEIALRRGATGGYGFRLGSSRSVGHIVAHVGGDGPAAGLLTPGDMVLAVNHNLLLRTLHEPAVKFISGTEKMHLLIGRSETAMANPQGAVRLQFHRETGQLLGLRLVTDVDEKGFPLASRVQKAMEGSVAESAGFLENDRLLVVNGLPLDRASRKVVLNAMSGVVGNVIVDVQRGASLNVPMPERSIIAATPPYATTEGPEAQSTPEKKGPPLVPQRRSSFLRNAPPSDARPERPSTVYIATDMPVPKKHMWSRFRGGTNGGPVLPATFAISDMGRELAEEALAYRDDGAFLLRKAHGKLVLSVVHERTVGHYTLQISLSQPYRDVDKALRKFVKFYSGVNKRQLEKIGLRCPLREYVMGASSNALNLMQQLHAAGSGSAGSEESGGSQTSLDVPSELSARTVSDSDAGTEVATEWGDDDAIARENREHRHPTGGGFEIGEGGDEGDGQNSGAPGRDGRLRIVTLSILGESSVDPSRAVLGASSTDPPNAPDGAEDEDGLPLISPTTTMFDLSDAEPRFALPPPPDELLDQPVMAETNVETTLPKWDGDGPPPPPPPPPPVADAIVVPPPVMPRRADPEAPGAPAESIERTPPAVSPKRKVPPPVKPKPKADRPSTLVTMKSEPEVKEVRPEVSEAPAMRESRAMTLPAPKAEPAEKEPRRRKLVRGGNKKETPMLQGYVEAMKALDGLEVYLDKCEAEWSTESPSTTPTPPPPPPLSTPQRAGFEFVSSETTEVATASQPPRFVNISESLLY